MRTSHEVSRKLIEATIERDDNDRRFEKFVADLFTVRDRISYETTAPTGDQGIDARGPVTLSEGVSVVCATTQQRGLKAKAASDIDKNTNRPIRIARLHVCFSQDVSEETLDEIRLYAVKQLPQAEIEVHGRSGLSDLSFRYQRPFLDNYGRELDEYTLWLKDKADEDDDDNQVNLLRIAVTTVFHPEIIKQRELLTDSLVVTALGDGRPKTMEEVSMAVASGLKLTHPPQPAYLIATVQSLIQRKILERTRFGFRLTTPGHDLRDRLLAQGAASSLDGRAAFQKLLGSFAESSLSNEEFSRLWRAVQRRLAKLFLNNGLKVVAELQQIAESEGVETPQTSRIGIVTETLHGLLDEIEGLRLNERVATRVAEVIREMLVNSRSDAFRWITELGVKYVVVCSLGLDPELERRIRDRISKWIIIPDTHVVLSFLCAGDEGHEACAAVLKQLDRLHATIWMMEPVLEETVHHAEISDQSFRDWYARVRAMRREFPDLDPADLLEEADNAFVKGFACTVGKNFRESDWHQYIGQFRGSQSRDVSPLADTLEAEIRCTFKEDGPQVAEVGRAFEKTLLGSDKREVGRFASLRCEWDGRLLGSVVLYRKKEPVGSRLIIMSDSDRLRNFLYRNVTADKRYGLKIADPAAIACALAVVPGTSVNLDSLRHFLFNVGFSLPDYLYESNVLAQAFTSARVLRNAALRDRLDEAMIRQSQR